MRVAIGLEGHRQAQTGLPARDNQFEVGGQGNSEFERRIVHDPRMGGQNIEVADSLLGGQTMNPDEVSDSESHPAQVDCGRGGQNRGVGRNGDIGEEYDYALSTEVGKLGGQRTGGGVGKTGNPGGLHSKNGVGINEHQGGQLRPLDLPASAHTPKNSIEPFMEGQATQWLKSLLPESQIGWWEVEIKGNGLVARFRWRDSRRQTLSFPKFNRDQLNTLEEMRSDEAAGILREQISAHLRNFFLDPVKRDKALAAAEKLGIDLSVHIVNPSTANGLHA